MTSTILLISTPAFLSASSPNHFPLSQSAQLFQLAFSSIKTQWFLLPQVPFPRNTFLFFCHLPQLAQTRPLGIEQSLNTSIREKPHDKLYLGPLLSILISYCTHIFHTSKLLLFTQYLSICPDQLLKFSIRHDAFLDHCFYITKNSMKSRFSNIC